VIEVWRLIIGTDGRYAVSSFGRVRREKSGCGTWAGRMLKSRKTKRGYLTIGVRYVSRVKKEFVHVLVARMFIGPCPVGKEVNHKDGVKLNCRSTNLEYLTHLENQQHAKRLGLYRFAPLRGEQHPRAKLTKNIVRRMRSLSKAMSQRQLAKYFGISSSNVWSVLSKHTWR
jgi:hypothetical protein